MIATATQPAAAQSEVETDPRAHYAPAAGGRGESAPSPPEVVEPNVDAQFADEAAQLNDEAQRLFAQGQYAASEHSVRRLLDLLERAVGADHPDYAMGLSMLGELRFLQEDLRGAEQCFRRGLEIRGATLGSRHPEYAVSLACLGGVLWRLGELDEAETRFRQSMFLRGEVLGQRHPESVQSRKELARLLRRRGDWPGAQKIITEGMGPAGLGNGGATAFALTGQVVALWGELRNVGEALAPSARLMEVEGVPPPAESGERLGALQHRFARLRDETLLRIDALRVPAPAVEMVGTLHDLAALLDDLTDLELRHDEREVMRQGALAVLDRVLGLTFQKDERFGPLVECQERVRHLRATIAGGHWLQLPAQTERLAEGTHALVKLLTLVDNLDALSDRAWADLHEGVSESLGQPIASAASRRQITSRFNPPPQPSLRRAPVSPAPDFTAPPAPRERVTAGGAGVATAKEPRTAAPASDANTVLLRDLAVASLVATMGRIINLPSESPAEMTPHRLMRVGHAPSVVERETREAAERAAEEAAARMKPARVSLPPNIARRLKIGLATVGGVAAGSRTLLTLFGPADETVFEHEMTGSTTADVDLASLALTRDMTPAGRSRDAE